MGDDRRADLDDEQYRRLLSFRTDLRRFLRWSGDQAAAVGLTAAQHQLLLAIRGHPGDQAPTIGDVAGHLLVRHHSAVELVDRVEQAGMIERVVDAHDRRAVRLVLTPAGHQVLDELTEAHLTELRGLAGVIDRALRRFDRP